MTHVIKTTLNIIILADRTEEWASDRDYTKWIGNLRHFYKMFIMYRECRGRIFSVSERPPHPRSVEFLTLYCKHLSPHHCHHASSPLSWQVFSTVMTSLHYCCYKSSPSLWQVFTTIKTSLHHLYDKSSQLIKQVFTTVMIIPRHCHAKSSSLSCQGDPGIVSYIHRMDLWH